MLYLNVSFYIINTLHDQQICKLLSINKLYVIVGMPTHTCV